MRYYELHCHQNIASACGRWSPEELVKAYAEMGYAGIVVTDHFFNGNCAIDRSLSWKEKIERFCAGYEQAKEAGEKYGLDVFFGFEYSVSTLYGEDLTGLSHEQISRLWRKDTAAGCDFLIYGLDKEWLLKQDESLLALPVNAFLKLVREEGGTVVQAHPYRLEKSYMDHICLFPDYTDGVEIFNGNPNTVGRPNRLAKAYAKEYGFFPTAGSDSHHGACPYLAITRVKRRAKDLNELLEMLKRRKAKFTLVKRERFKK